uniref:Uncharacterized protein n=1 Tax=Arundo donax TaxID=35708 RepID=A0A0A9HR37_ARUDO
MRSSSPTGVLPVPVEAAAAIGIGLGLGASSEFGNKVDWVVVLMVQEGLVGRVVLKMC